MFNLQNIGYRFGEMGVVLVFFKGLLAVALAFVISTTKMQCTNDYDDALSESEELS